MKRAFSMLFAALLLVACSESSPAKDSGTPGTEGMNSCRFPGTWKGPVPAGPFAGQTNVWEIAASGTTHSTIGTTTVDGTWKVNGTWQLSSGSVTLIDTNSTPTSVACPSTQEGTYSVTFSTDCKTMTLRATNEPCDGRKVAVDNFAPTRQ